MNSVGSCLNEDRSRALTIPTLMLLSTFIPRVLHFRLSVIDIALLQASIASAAGPASRLRLQDPISKQTNPHIQATTIQRCQVAAH